MTATKPSLEEITGYLGVGSLLLLGVFFVIDGPTNFWTTVEKYANTASFAILFTVPLLVIAYVLGLLASLTVQVAIERMLTPVLTPELFALAAHKSREPLLNRYLEVERTSRLLHGCTLAFVLLAIGSLLERRYLPPGQESVSTICFILGIAISGACPFLSRHLQRQLSRYIAAFEPIAEDMARTQESA